MVNNNNSEIHHFTNVVSALSDMNTELTNKLSIPLHGIVLEFQELMSKKQEYDSKDKELAGRVRQLSQSRLDYYKNAHFGFIIKFFSSLCNLFTLKTFTSSGQLGLNLADKIINGNPDLNQAKDVANENKSSEPVSKAAEVSNKNSPTPTIENQKNEIEPKEQISIESPSPSYSADDTRLFAFFEELVGEKLHKKALTISVMKHHNTNQPTFDNVIKKLTDKYSTNKRKVTFKTGKGSDPVIYIQQVGEQRNEWNVSQQTIEDLINENFKNIGHLIINNQTSTDIPHTYNPHELKNIPTFVNKKNKEITDSNKRKKPNEQHETVNFKTTTLTSSYITYNKS